MSESVTRKDRHMPQNPELNRRLAQIESRLARIEETMITKADLAAALDGIARNIDIKALGVQLGALRADQRVLAATVDRIDVVIINLLSEIGTEHARVRQLADRLAGLEEPK